MLYSCTHMATVGFKGLKYQCLNPTGTAGEEACKKLRTDRQTDPHTDTSTNNKGRLKLTAREPSA